LKGKCCGMKYFGLVFFLNQPPPYGHGFEVFRSLGEGLGCVLIKSTLGSGKPRRDAREQWGAMGDKGDSLQATWNQEGPFLSQLEGAK
jgi:hypothetical protein